MELIKQAQPTNGEIENIVIDDKYSFQVNNNTFSIQITNNSNHILYFIVCGVDTTNINLDQCIEIIPHDLLPLRVSSNIKPGGSDRCVCFTKETLPINYTLMLIQLEI